MSSVGNNIPFQDRQSAINWLNNRDNWSIGCFYTVLYLDNDEVEAIVAIGIKNTSECGPTGAYSSSLWRNKYYPNGAHGSEFYKIISDTGMIGFSNRYDGTIELYTTVVNMNDSSYSVANEDNNQIISDPLRFLDLTPVVESMDNTD